VIFRSSSIYSVEDLLLVYLFYYKLICLKANEHHRKHLESLPETAYPLVAQGDAAEIPESQRITNEALGQR